jgi:uncharacterized protein
LVKLVAPERESDALEHWLVEQVQQAKMASRLAFVEVVRAVWRRDPRLLPAARSLLGRLESIELTDDVLERATTITPPSMRSLDAIQLASALLIREDLTAFVAYDRRLLDAAEAEGLPVMNPS